jgi:hypothetical protein
MVYHHTTFFVPISNGSLVIAMKPEAKYKFRAVAMLFTFYEQVRKCAQSVTILVRSAGSDEILEEHLLIAWKPWEKRTVKK